MPESLEGFETETAASMLETPGNDLSGFEESERQPEKHTSYSQISSYTRCPMVTYWRYIKGFKAPPAAAMCFGTSIHKALEHNFGQKLYSHTDLPLSDVTDAFRDSWKDVSREAVFDVEKDENPDSMLDEGVMMVGKYHAEMAPKIQPNAIEMKFSLNLPGITRTIIGYIDLIDEKEVILDHKTSRMTPNALTLAKDHQLTLYKMAYRSKLGHDPKGLRYDYMVRKSSKKTGSWVEIHPMSVQKNESHEIALVETFKTVLRKIKLCLFEPNPNTFICTPSACGFFGRCYGKILANEKPAFLDEIHQMQEDALKNLASGALQL